MIKSLNKDYFFKFFPDANIIVSGWDIQDKGFKTEEKHNSKYTINQLIKLNHEKRGIYFTACDVEGNTHGLENHKAIRAWFCDIDVSSRAEQNEGISDDEIKTRKDKALSKIFSICICDEKVNGKSLPIPSLVVETRNGFHIYWFAWHEEKMDAKYFPRYGLYKPSIKSFAFIQNEIAKLLDGDEKALKLVQLMRLPQFYNWKGNKQNPCQILIEFSSFRYYTEDLLLKYLNFPEHEKAVIENDYSIFEETKKEEEPKKESFWEGMMKHVFKGKFKSNKNNDIFDYVANLPQDQALIKLSGIAEVNGEQYELEELKNGKKNIKINGVLCSAFIDTQKNLLLVRSGTGKGSPNVIEWLKWYNPEFNTNPSKLAETLKNIYQQK